MNDNLLICQHLYKAYDTGFRKVEAVRDVSLKLRRNSFTAIMGPSGSGKTTLLNLIGTLDVPAEGELIFEGSSMQDLSDDELADFRRRNIGFIFQLFNLIPSLNVLENVVLPLLPFRKQIDFDLEQRASKLIELVGLVDRWDHLPGELSGGEQQRVAIARAMINYPKLILADEPTGNLDLAMGEQVMNLLQKLVRDMDATILLVTHNEKIASRAQEILHIADGRLQ